MKKLVSVLLIVSICISFVLPVSVFAAGTSYDITNPYETVDWDNWNQYKTQLHSHTLYSDGEMDIKDVVEEYYAQGYDILAITDHGVVNKGWNVKPEMLDLVGYNQYIKDLKPISKERWKSQPAPTETADPCSTLIRVLK